MSAIASKGENIGIFMTGKKLELKRCENMTLLTKRTMGGFMSPLKDCN